MSKKPVPHLQDNIAAHPQGFVKELEAAVKIFDRKLADELCTQLIEHLRSRARPYPYDASKKTLSALRRKRYFDLISRVADVLIQTGQDRPNIRRQYAQALLDQGYISAALDVLHVLEQHCLENQDEFELSETRGLIGRARKQAYMDAVGEEKPGTAVRRSLEQAVSAYAGVYEKKSDLIWHGINTVALLSRARHDRLRLDVALPKFTSIAKDILKKIAEKKKVNLWDYATAGEASLALEDYPQALDWILKYTQEHPEADAFEYASTLRQFEEVWGLDEGDKKQAQILHLLRAALLRQEGGQIEIANPTQNIAIAADLEADKQFEQILGKDRFKTFQWYCTGLDRAAGVAQILDRFGNGQGSGFLVQGKDIHESIGDEWVVVTNAHVISSDPMEQSASPAALSPDDVRIRFEAQDPGQEFEVEKVIFSSPRTELDCTIVSLQSPITQAKPYPIAKRLPMVGKNQRVYVIGHPGGRGLSYSMNDNLLLDHEPPRIHYRAPTEGGSSGSPVFNQQWDLIALHHAGGMNMKKLNGKEGTYPANEGIYFHSIRDAVAAMLN